MLIRNRTNFNLSAVEYTSGWLGVLDYTKESTWMNQPFEPKAGVPNGYVDKSFVMPYKAGGLSGRTDFSINCTASGAMGVNADASATLDVIVANADGQLIVSGFGTSSLLINSTGSVVAVLNAIASTEFTINMNHLASFVDAEGWANCYMDLVASANGTLTAVAVMSGDTIDDTSLTPATIWSYDNRTLTTDVATKGDVWGSKFA